MIRRRQIFVEKKIYRFFFVFKQLCYVCIHFLEDDTLLLSLPINHSSSVVFRLEFKYYVTSVLLCV